MESIKSIKRVESSNGISDSDSTKGIRGLKRMVFGRFCFVYTVITKLLCEVRLASNLRTLS
jgi:hypothetical protein